MNVDTPGRQLLFSTVRITNVLKNGVPTTGTGFLLFVDVEGQDAYAPVLITNKHVVADSGHLIAHFIKRKTGEDQPELGQGVDVALTPDGWIGHPDPDTDVAVVPLGPLFQQHGSQLFTRALPMALLATEVKNLYTDAIEEITFIGYPDGRHDPKHLTPIVRRGITATPLDLDMGGAPTFLIDGSVFGGSSGSPVFLFNEGTYRIAEGLQIGTRIALVGIIARTWVRGDALPIEVSAPHVKIAKELNLGVAFNSRAIKETVEAFAAAAGFKIRGATEAEPVAIDPTTQEPTPLT
ncbi:MULTISPECIES: trypsin-like peptidase domain-containing protein [unclassified Streptomyces]|uniref:trypsin-like peptidase domain-containing protein n=1 Tax=unclassified Streptomyces TaxID=2593676 RepID=UPI00190B3C0B|nr:MULTISPECIES: trypsin-like peptidase domain-containing protein [unclassified Streptomyces]MBK3563202.1 trypsin-like peptidase domain-containing protein [Streptomyces sp. MBT62]MBK6013191.1 trypsin-like peptidase domain-containing protein [Streptomyces sp. MBT53]